MISKIIWLFFKKRFENIQGYLSTEEGKWLFTKSFTLPKKSRIVEIGSFKGKSTFCLALGSLFSGNSINAIDTFKGNSSDFVKSLSSGQLFNKGFFDEFKSNLSYLNLIKNIKVYKGYSSEVAKKWDEIIDFIFIDGSHSFKDVLADFNNYYPYVTKGGLMAFHDVNPGWKGPYKAWHEVISKKLVNIGQVDNIAYGYKK